MGTTIIRCAMLAFRPTKVGRIVLVAPPNRGVGAARRWGGLLKSVVGIIDQMAARPDSFVATLPPLTGVEFGVIAARFDHLVRVKDTQTEGQADHLVVNAMHTAVYFPKCLEATLRFLETGRFNAEARRH